LSRRLRLTVLGPATLQLEGRALPAVPAKALELLCYLLLHTDRAHERETLARLLWPDSADRSARKYLRQALWHLHTALGTDAARALHVDPARVRIDPAAWWCDADVVERVYRRCREAAPGALAPDLAAAAEHAVALYRGELLESWDQDWCVRERNRWHLMHLDLLDRLVHHCIDARALDRGLAHAGRLLELDPVRETTHRQLMRLHLAAGDRTAALRQYRRCVQALAAELDVGPDPETVALHLRIRTGAPVPAAAGPQPLEARLDAISAALEALQRDVALLVMSRRDDVVRMPAAYDEPVTPLRLPTTAQPLGAGGDQEAG
jgi:DNA-binding SARP family transcriptional activator